MNSSDDNVNFVDLVKKAQRGCHDSMDSLAKLAERKVSVYIYRLTLDRNLTEDLQQETLLQMVKSLKNLRKPERFWAWLYRTALSKVQHHYRWQQRERKKYIMTTSEKENLLRRLSGSYGDGLKNLINKELSQAIIDAMGKLKFRHRNILVLRCCEQLPYSEIAKVMDCSETAAQILFYRAKNLLKRNLSKHGFGKGLFVSALGLFGTMTAPADAAPVTVSAAFTKVGAVAKIIGGAGTKLGLTAATIITAAAITVGSVTSLNDTDGIAGFGGSGVPERSEIKSFHYVKQAWDKTGSPNPNLARGRSLSKGAYEQWYYFPEGVDGPMFMMMQRWDPKLTNKLCSWLQNGKGNFYFQAAEKTIYQYSYHLPMRYLTTRRLPSDTPEFTEFLDQIEGESTGVDYARDPKTGLLVGAMDNRFYNAQNFKSSFSYNKMDEKSFDSFRYPWPEDAPVIDERDTMHKRGWTYFRISGEINGKQVQGTGRIPFIYDAYRERPPWLKLNIAGSLEIVDGPSQAYLADASGKIVSAYPAGSFFKGLGGPWMGMHTVDLIRRDAAEKRVKFSTKSFGGDKEHYGKAEVTFFAQARSSQIRIVCTIDIDKDVLEKIEFFGNDGTENNEQGVLEFTYLEDIEYLVDEFGEPAKIKVRKAKQRDSMGMLWLIELAQGTLGQ